MFSITVGGALGFLAFGLAGVILVYTFFKYFYKKDLSGYLLTTSILSTTALISRLIVAGVEVYRTNDVSKFADAIFNPIRYYDEYLVQNFWFGFTGLLIWYLFLYRVSFFIVSTFIVDPFRKNDKFLTGIISLPFAYLLLNFFAYDLPNANRMLYTAITEHFGYFLLIIVTFIIFPAILYYNIPLKLITMYRELQLKNLEYKLKLMSMKKETSEKQEKFLEKLDEEIEKRPAYVYRAEEIKPKGIRLSSDDKEELVYDPQSDTIYIIEKENKRIFVFPKEKQNNEE